VTEEKKIDPSSVRKSVFVRHSTLLALEEGKTLEDLLYDYERQILLTVATHHRFDPRKIAQTLAITAQSLHHRLKQKKIDLEQLKKIVFDYEADRRRAWRDSVKNSGGAVREKTSD
jgi:DNA-binding NtrC family response regulator